METKYVVGFLLMIIIIEFCWFNQMEAKAKTIPFSKKLTIPIQKGKFYRVNELLKTVQSASVTAGNLRRKIQRGNKVILSGKGLKIKKQSFKAKKEGNYKLRISIKNKRYVFPLCAVNKIYQVNPSSVAKITISYRNSGPPTIVTVEKPDIMNQVIEKLNNTRYTFQFLKELSVKYGFSGYIITFYKVDGSIIKEFRLTNDTDYIKARPATVKFRSSLGGQNRFSQKIIMIILKISLAAYYQITKITKNRIHFSGRIRTISRVKTKGN